MVERTVSVGRSVDHLREVGMRSWRDFLQQMAAELFLLAYVIAWVAVLLVTHLLTNNGVATRCSLLSCRGCFLRGLKVQRVSEALKLTVIVERRWSFAPKCECAQKAELLFGHIPTQ